MIKALPGPNRWRGGRERGGRRTRLREKLCCSIFFLTGARYSNQAENCYMRGQGFSFRKKRFHFRCFCGACCAVLCFLLRTYQTHTAYQKKKRITLPGVCTYVRHVSERSGRNRPRREAYVASELFSPEAWLQDSWHYQVITLHLQS